jgi:predicted exporter
VTCFAGQDEWIGVPVTSEQLAALSAADVKFIPIDSELYYRDTIKGHTAQAVTLLLAALTLMAVYLLVMHRSVVKVLVILMPVAFTSVLGAILCHSNDVAISIAHIIGMIIVISLSVDYTSIAVSVDYSDDDRSKIILTGVAAILSFVGLAFARHPFVLQLGVTVCLGVFVSLIFALAISQKRVVRSRSGGPLRFSR